MTIEQAAEKAAKAAIKLARKYKCDDFEEDLAQDARLKIIETGPDAPVVKAQRVVIDWLRLRLGKQGQKIGVITSVEDVDIYEAPDKFTDCMAKTAIWSAVNSMTPKRAKTTIDYYQRDMTHSDMAIDSSKQAVNQRLKEARISLKIKLAKVHEELKQ